MSNPKTGAGTWGGGGSPFAIGSKKLGMWLFILSDTLTFTAMLMAYSYVRIANPDWPRPFDGHSITLASIMTLCLLSSSVTMVFSVLNAQHGDRKRAVQWLVATIVGGLAFIVLHANEWMTLISSGVTPFGNPWDVPLFGAAFFTLTGLHMTHVTLGVIYLGVVAWGYGSGRFEDEDVEVSGLYWHFVDLVWMFIFPLVYLMSNVI